MRLSINDSADKRVFAVCLPDAYDFLVDICIHFAAASD